MDKYRNVILAGCVCSKEMGRVHTDDTALLSSDVKKKNQLSSLQEEINEAESWINQRSVVIVNECKCSFIKFSNM